MAYCIRYPRIIHETSTATDSGKVRMRRVQECSSGMRGLCAWVGLMVLWAFPLPAPATLGEDAASIVRDGAAMDASLRISPTARYELHELRTPAGTTVRQYVLPSGTVFAIAWEGPLMPDARQILGPYFDRYASAAAAVQAGRRQVLIHDSDFVLQSSGQMRSFSGKAYLPRLLPQGVPAEELQ